MTALTFPAFDPIALSLGPIHIRWYGLAYLAGFLGGWAYARYLCRLTPTLRPHPEDIDNLFPFLVFGVILGGRFGYVLFYNLPLYIAHPLDIFKVWEGGMSFHGGLMGVAIAIILFAWREKIPTLALGDIIATVAPVGLLLGRLANFVNGELYGRVTTVPWGIIFPRGYDLPRHPSQLYEAGLEGILLGLILFILAKRPNLRNKSGFLFGVFLVGYGLCRTFVEYFREPDEQIGFLLQYFSMGQLLSIPMILLGVALMVRARQAG